MLTKREKLTKIKKRVKHFFNPYKGDSTPLFICGEQRSGTNFLINVLNRCSQTECYLENDDEAFSEYLLRELDLIERLINTSRAQVVAFKPICDSQNLGQLLERFPNSKAIWTFRHYHDVVNSSLKQFKQHRKYLELMLYDKEKASWRIQNVTKENLDLVKHYFELGVSDSSARTLIWYLRNSLFYQQALDTNPNVIMTKYEDLVTRPTGYFKRIFDFLDIPNNERASAIAFDSSLHKEPPPEAHPEIIALCEGLYEKMLDSYAKASQFSVTPEETMLTANAAT